jgi:oligopeptide transport system permease protein
MATPLKRWGGGRPVVVLSVALLVVLALLALIGPAVAPTRYDYMDKAAVWAAPSLSGHWLGTDSLGRDMFARTFMGLRISLVIGVAATGVAVAIGILFGVVAGYAGGWTDEMMMRVVDALYAIPFMFLVILLMAAFGNSIVLIFVAIGAVEWLTIARIVRAQTLSLRQAAFVEAARSIGLTRGAILRRHVVPNLLAPVIAYATLTVPAAILAESFLSFLGLGVQEPLASLGALIARGTQDAEMAPWLLFIPVTVMVCTLLALTLLGDNLRRSPAKENG